MRSVPPPADPESAPPEPSESESPSRRSFFAAALAAATVLPAAASAQQRRRWPLMSQTSAQLVTANAAAVKTQLQESTIYRAAFSQRQLYQRMVEFWTDHFTQDVGKVGYLLVADQRDVIRKHALDTFPNLLK